MTTEPKANRYTIRYETKTSPARDGEQFVLATSEVEALAKFDEAWGEHGDEIPSRWVTQTWAVEN